MRRVFAIVAIAIVALMTMVSLPLLMGRHPCHRIDGVIALITMALLPLIWDSVVTLVMMALLPSSSWHCLFVAMVSVSSLMCRHPCHHCNGIVALITMALLPLIRRCLCCHCNSDCCPFCNSISAIVDLAWSSSWRHCPCNNGVVAIINAQESVLLLSWCHYPHCDGGTAINAQASLQSGHLCHHCNKVAALVAMAMLQLSSWYHCPCHNGVVANVDAQVSLPLSRWRRCPQNQSKVGWV